MRTFVSVLFAVVMFIIATITISAVAITAYDPTPDTVGFVFLVIFCHGLGLVLGVIYGKALYNSEWVQRLDKAIVEPRDNHGRTETQYYSEMAEILAISKRLDEISMTLATTHTDIDALRSYVMRNSDDIIKVSRDVDIVSNQINGGNDAVQAIFYRIEQLEAKVAKPIMSSAVEKDGLTNIPASMAVSDKSAWSVLENYVTNQQIDEMHVLIISKDNVTDVSFFHDNPKSLRKAHSKLAFAIDNGMTYRLMTNVDYGNENLRTSLNGVTLTT
jgi:hypothetical protein